MALAKKMGGLGGITSKFKSAGQAIASTQRMQGVLAEKKINFKSSPPTPLKLLQKDLPEGMVEVVVHGLQGELLLGPELVRLDVHMGGVKKRLQETSHKAIIAGHLTRALKLQTYIVSGANIFLLHDSRAVIDLCTVKSLLDASELPEPPVSPTTRTQLSEVSGALKGKTPKSTATRLELVAVIFVRKSKLVAWGDALAGGHIPPATAKELGSNVTFVTGNERAFAALTQNGKVATWGDPACGGTSKEAAEELNRAVFHLVFNNWAFAALREGGKLVTWGDSLAGGDPGDAEKALQLRYGVARVCCTEYAFAVVKDSGEVITWGDSETGGDCSSVASQLSSDVYEVWGNEGAFVALKHDGTMVPWGNASAGGEFSSTVAAELTTTSRPTTSCSSSSKKSSQALSKVDTVVCSRRAFAALKKDGAVVSWGDPLWGGDSSEVKPLLTKGTYEIKTNGRVFAALKQDSSVVIWGNKEFGGDVSSVAPKLMSGIKGIVFNEYAFAVMKFVPGMKEGSGVVAWGDPSHGGDCSAVADELVTVVEVCPNAWAMAARRKDGSVVAWGDQSSGGDASGIAQEIEAGGGATQLFKTARAFAALLKNGGVVAWGDPASGGDHSAVDWGSTKVVDICSNDHAFAALTAEGSVKAWGNILYGGQIAEDTAAELTHGIRRVAGNKFSFIAFKTSGNFVT